MWTVWKARWPDGVHAARTLSAYPKSFSSLDKCYSTAKAKMAWPEGKMETFALMALIFLSIVTGISLGAAVFMYRSSINLRFLSCRRQILQATLWVEYIAWASSGFETRHTVQEGAAIRLRDLEGQLFEELAVPQPFWSRQPSCHFHTKNGSTPISTESTNESTPERPHIFQPQISTANGTNSAITQNASKIATYDSSSISFIQSASSSGSSTAEDNGKIASHESISSAQSSSSPYKTSESTQQLITPLPRVYTAKFSNHVESSRLAVSHGYFSTPFVINYLVHPARPARTKPHHHKSSDSPASSNIFTRY